MAKLPRENPTFREVELAPRAARLIASDITAAGEWKEGDGSEWNLFFFRWLPRSINAVIYSRNHRPDVCLPAAGLRQISDDGTVFLEVGEINLPFRRYTYESDGKRLHVFFCQWEDGAEKQRGLLGSKQAGRLQSVLTGRRKLGQQTLEIIATNHETLEQAEEALRNRLPDLIRIEKAPAT
jgi:hypothetical protein